MGASRAIVVATTTLSLLSACGSPSPEAPAKTSSTAQTPSASATAVSPPTMPAVARTHTVAGAKAFIVHYWSVVDYVQQTLDTRPLEALSDNSCAGCWAGIRAMKKLARQHARLTGGQEKVTILTSEDELDGHSILLTFNLANESQSVKISGKKELVHPPGKTKELMILLPRENGWIAGEMRGLQK